MVAPLKTYNNPSLKPPNYRQILIFIKIVLDLNQIQGLNIGHIINSIGNYLVLLVLLFYVTVNETHSF